MKIITYSFAFLIILTVAGIGFFSFTTPTVPQKTITTSIDPNEAFKISPSPADIAPAAE